MVLSPLDLPGWDDVQIIGILEQEFDLPAYLENDANAGVLADRKNAFIGISTSGRVLNVLYATVAAGWISPALLDSLPTLYLLYQPL